MDTKSQLGGYLRIFPYHNRFGRVFKTMVFCNTAVLPANDYYDPEFDQEDVRENQPFEYLEIHNQSPYDIKIYFDSTHYELVRAGVTESIRRVFRTFRLFNTGGGTITVGNVTVLISNHVPEGL